MYIYTYTNYHSFKSTQRTGYKTTVCCMYTEVSRLVVHKNVQFVPVCTRFLVLWNPRFRSHKAVGLSASSVSGLDSTLPVTLHENILCLCQPVSNFYGEPKLKSLIHLHTAKNVWKAILYVCMRTGSLSKSVQVRKI